MSTPLMFITQTLDRTITLIELFGLSKPRQKVEPTLKHWLHLIADGIKNSPSPLNAADEMRITFKLVKYKFDAYVASMYGTAIPSPPWEFSVKDDPKVLIGGKFMVYTRQYLLEGPRRMAFISTIKQVKKGLPRPTTEMLRQSELDLVEKLTSDPSEYTPEEEAYKKEFIYQLRRTTQEIFRGKRFTISEQTKAFFPSTSANYNMSRTKLGALSEIAMIIESEGLATHDELIDIEKIDKDGDAIMGEDEPNYKVKYDDTRLQEKVGHLMSILKHKALREIPSVEPVALAEAMKVRVITKGPPILYTYLKPLQRFLHRILKQHKVFQLIGNRGISVDVLLSQELDYFRAHEKLNSGDYNDATNEMRSWVSEIVAKELCGKKCLDLDTDDTHLVIRSLIEHVFYGKDQKHGTLMGSILNFIILCISNATLCRWSMEVSDKSVLTLDEVRLLINGDDCLFPINEEGRQYWIKMGKVVGLNVNLSKSFYSREFCNINSRDFSVKPASWNPEEHVVEPVPYINAGLLFGMKRSEAKTGLDDIVDKNKTTGALARELIKDTPFEMREKVLALFIHYHPELKETSLPWHIPEWAGGVGLPDLQTDYSDIDDPSPWRNARYERDIMGLKYMLLNWKDDDIRPKALSDQSILTVHRYAEDKMKPYVTFVEGKDVKDRSDNVYSTLYGLFCCEWLFKVDSVYHDLFKLYNSKKDAEKQRKLAIIRHNETVWKRILNKKSLPAADKRTWDYLKGQLRPREFIDGELVEDMSALRKNPKLHSEINKDNEFIRNKRILWRSNQ